MKSLTPVSVRTARRRSRRKLFAASIAGRRSRPKSRRMTEPAPTAERPSIPRQSSASIAEPRWTRPAPRRAAKGARTRWLRDCPRLTRCSLWRLRCPSAVGDWGHLVAPRRWLPAAAVVPANDPYTYVGGGAVALGHRPRRECAGRYSRSHAHTFPYCSRGRRVVAPAESLPGDFLTSCTRRRPQPSRCPLEASAFVWIRHA